MFIRKTVALLTSLRLTVVLLAFAILLVFVGTLAQVDEGLYGAQAHYFNQWLVLGVSFHGHTVPIILPGGFLIGTLMLVNLVAAHIYRFRFTTKKIGIQLAHGGVIVLLVGQLATVMLARELQMHFVEGEKRGYSESISDYELIFAAGQQVTAIPANLLKEGQELKPESLPFTVRVDKYWKNSAVTFRAPMMRQTQPPATTNGVAVNFDFSLSPEAKSMDQKNVPTVFVTLTGPQGSLGQWVGSGWAGDSATLQSVTDYYQSQVGPEMASRIVAQLGVPQIIQYGGRTFTLVMRPARFYHDFSLTLVKATHTVYPGTDIPKDFRSRVLVENPKSNHEHREVEISMNHPLRYGGFTFYQYQMTAGEVAERAGVTPSSVLSVVRNPSWLTPYIGCIMVGLGLVIQFVQHLWKFVTKRKTA